jgi:hypothetical protein
VTAKPLVTVCLLLLALAGIVAGTVLAALHVALPDFIPAMSVASLTAAAGITVPSSSSTSSPPAAPTPALVAPLPNVTHQP